MPIKKRTEDFWGYDRAYEFCKEVGGTLEIKWDRLGQKYYRVTYFV